MSLRIANLTVNTTRPRELADWWISAAGGRVNHDYGEYVFATVGGMSVGFQQAEPAGPNRMHIDLSADDRAAEVTRLTGLGATVVAEHEMPGLAWTVLTDPDDNQFCVAQES